MQITFSKYCRRIWTFVIVFLLGIICIHSLNAQTHFVNKNPFPNKCFIENKGQWQDPTLEPAFVLWTGNNNIFLSKKGFILRWVSVEKANPLEEKKEFFDAFDKENHLEEGEEKEKRIQLQFDTLEMHLVNANPNPIIEAFYPSKHYYTYGPEKWNSRGYQKVIYRNIYPNIDFIIEISNNSNALIKYSFVLNPGANSNDIKIKYNKQTFVKPHSVKIDLNNYWISDFGLKAHTINGINIPCSFRSFENEIRFNIPQLKIKDTIVIDPFLSKITKFKSIAGSFYKDYGNLIVHEDFDNDNNVYILSVGKVYPQIAKYDIKGNLIWIFSGQLPAINWYSSQFRPYDPSPGCFLIDKNKSKIFVATGAEHTGYGARIVRLNLNGNYDSFIGKSERFRTEIWDLSLYCKDTSIIASGGGIYHTDSYYSISQNDSSSSPKFYNISHNYISNSHDVARSIVDENGYLYTILNYIEKEIILDSLNLKPPKTIGTTKVYLIKPLKDLKTNYYKTDLTKYSGLSEAGNYPNISKWEGITTRNNCLAVNGKYVFVYDGKRYLALDKITGKILAVDSIKYHTGLSHLRYTIGQEGIAVDNCNNVYLGGDSTNVHILHFDGSKFHYDTCVKFIQNTSSNTMDVRLNENTNTLFVSGDSFVAATSFNLKCRYKPFEVATKTIPFCQGNYLASVTAGDSNQTYTFKWVKKSYKKDSILRVINKKFKSTDTLFKPNIHDTIELLVAQNYDCNGNYQKALFIANLNDTTLVKDTLCAGQFFQIRNRKFYKDTAFTDHLTNRILCDSTVKYKLVFLPIKKDSIKYLACVGDTLRFGNKIVTKNSSFNDTLSQRNGCDSILFRNIVYSGSEIQQTRHLCKGDTIKIGKFRHFTSNKYSDTLSNYLGCDSIINTQLFVHSDTNYQKNYKLCLGDTIIFSGKTYTKTSVHIDSFHTFWGCDSVITRNIVFYNPSKTQLKYTLCKGQTFNFKGTQIKAPANFTDTLITYHGCDSVVTILLNPSLLTANFSIDSTLSPSITFAHNSNNAIKFIWNFGDGNSNTTDKSTQHTYNNTEDKEIEVCLSLEDSMGCKDTVCQKINIYKLTYFLFNVFTPNNDGKNDNLYIGHKGGTFLYDILIYNRWGALVFEKNQESIQNTNNFWNGKIMNTGADCPAGSYFVIYRFYLNDSNKSPQEIKGSVTLIRD